MDSHTPALHFPTLGRDDVDDVDDVADSGVVTRFDVERYHVGELDESERRRVEAAMATTPKLQAFLESLRADDAAFLIEQPVVAFERRLADVAPPSLMGRVFAFFAQGKVQLSMGLGAAACAAVIAITVPGATPGGDGIRTKGGHVDPALSFFVKMEDGARLGTPGEKLHPGDAIQLALKDADKPALVVLGIDGAGVISIYTTEAQVDGAGRTKGAAPRVLQASMVLDDTMGTERFFAVYGESVDDVVAKSRAAAEALAADVVKGTTTLDAAARLQLPERYPQSSVFIEKVR